MAEISFAQLGWLLGIVGVAFGIWGQVRGGRKDTDNQARETATILADLNYLKRNSDAQGIEIKTLAGQVAAGQASSIEIMARLGVVEQRANEAHKRIDALCHKRALEADEP